MKTLIIYGTKTGTAKQCAEALATRLPNATVCDIEKDKPNPADYDVVVLGGGIRMGLLHNDIRQYAENCKEILKTKRLGVFITCGYDDLAEKTIANNLPADLLAAAKVKMSFGGEMDLKRVKGFIDRMVCKMCLKEFKKNGMELPRLYPKRYTKFATELMSE